MPLNPVDIEEVPPFLVSITPVCLCYSQHQEHSLLIVNLAEHEERGVEAVLELVLVLAELGATVLVVLVEVAFEHLVQQ
jgi:hypothetical protein